MTKRSRRNILTMPRKKRKTKAGDPNAPTDDEWETMRPFNKFVVEDGEGEKHCFKVGNHVLVLPPGPEPDFSDYWVAIIRDIRSRKELSDVWLLVQWYYSPIDVACVIKSFDAKSCGKYERINSQHFDFIHCSTVEGVTTVTRYDETALEPDHIEDGFFCRYDLDRAGRNITPKPGSQSCFCAQPYNPNRDSLMHFCPRPSCRTSYHHACLVKGKHKDNGTPALRPMRLLSVSPDSDESFVISSDKRRGRKTAQSLSTEMLANLPQSLIKVAQQPIVKGAKFGVTGNVREVVQARRIVYDVLGGSTLPDNWEEQIKAAVKISHQLLPFICPSCKGPI